MQSPRFRIDGRIIERTVYYTLAVVFSGLIVAALVRPSPQPASKNALTRSVPQPKAMAFSDAKATAPATLAGSAVEVPLDGTEAPIVYCDYGDWDIVDAGGTVVAAYQDFDKGVKTKRWSVTPETVDRSLMVRAPDDAVPGSYTVRFWLASGGGGCSGTFRISGGQRKARRPRSQGLHGLASVQPDLARRG